ncbi:MAG TPA: hypothetical protein VHW45_08235 [Candidatus Sulfotelmatobacter sp.]|nr:hypothetical protein [Candidatus Sulfotelmatobacter sp.]
MTPRPWRLLVCFRGGTVPHTGFAAVQDDIKDGFLSPLRGWLLVRVLTHALWLGLHSFAALRLRGNHTNQHPAQMGIPTLTS